MTISDTRNEMAVDKAITNGLKQFSEEDLFLIYDEAVFFHARRWSTNKIRNRNVKHDPRDILKIERYQEFKELRNEVVEKLKDLRIICRIERVFINVKRRKEFSIPLNHLHAIKNDKRLCSFTFNYIKNMNKNGDPKFYINNNPYMQINHLIMSENIIISHRFSTRIKDSQKNFITKIKKLNNEKNLNEKNFNEWAYTYLINNNSEFGDIDYYPVNKKERSDLIIYFLDYLSCFKEKDYGNLTNNLYRAWTQKKFRDSNKTNKNSSPQIPKNVQKKLKEISKKINRTEEEILSELISDKYRELMINRS
ncbi:MAG: hypothetical protein BGN93_05610 [Acinetobacter sp. 39-4]|nr:MAG: hypothetical protein BGN93_05610 [Acinetobacter sp. 39-4]OJU96564.1 MAG: hypothetical protein BGO19_03950 [Acinetobacter sp. 38-8]